MLPDDRLDEALKQLMIASDDLRTDEPAYSSVQLARRHVIEAIGRLERADEDGESPEVEQP